MIKLATETNPRVAVDAEAEIIPEIAQNKYITIRPSINTMNDVPRCILSNTRLLDVKELGLIPATTNWSPLLEPMFSCGHSPILNHWFTISYTYSTKVSNLDSLCLNHGDARYGC